LIGKTLKVFLHPPPPSERESLVKVVGLMIQKMNLLSTLKRGCENYLFIYKFVKQGDANNGWGAGGAGFQEFVQR